MQIEDILRFPSALWMEESGCEGDIVLASRVRLARNIKNCIFPVKAESETLVLVAEKVCKCVPFLQKADKGKNKYCYLNLHTLSTAELGMLVAQHTISPRHAATPENRAAVVRDDMRASIMINEEDHLRIQAMQAGLNLTKAYETAADMDDILEKQLGYAYDAEFGYLTSCPTNVGTGMRTSVMLHLPALSLAKRMKKIVETVTAKGLTVRGFYGEGSEAVGNIFQVSNQKTFGYSEGELIEIVADAVKGIIEQERLARQVFLKEAGEFLHDKVWRAYGVLSHLKSISWQESLTLLSFVRMGADLGVISDFQPHVFNRLLVLCNGAALEMAAEGEKLDKVARRKMRADVIRKQLTASNQ